MSSVRYGCSRPDNSFEPNPHRRGLVQALGAMRKHAVLLAILALPGCTTGRYYLPVEGADAYTGKSCGHPYGGAQVKLNDQIHLFVALNPNPSDLVVSLQLSVIGSSRFEFLSPNVQLLPVNGSAIILEISPTSGGHLPSLDPNVPLVARMPYRPYIANLRAPLRTPGKISLQLPPFRVDGQVIAPKVIVFEYTEKAGMVSCIQ